MTKTICVLGALFSLLLWIETPLMAQVGGMHRQRGVERDPLLFSFFQVVEALEKGGEEGWKEVRQRSHGLSPILKRYTEKFGIDVAPKLEKAVKVKEADEVLKFLALVIYLGIKERFEEAHKEITNFLQSKRHLSVARSYYELVLSGNVKRKDMLIHARIVDEFDNAIKAVEGGVDFLHPDPQKLVAAFQKIEGNLVEVYPYFRE